MLTEQYPNKQVKLTKSVVISNVLCILLNLNVKVTIIMTLHV